MLTLIIQSYLNPLTSLVSPPGDFHQVIRVSAQVHPLEAKSGPVCLAFMSRVRIMDQLLNLCIYANIWKVSNRAQRCMSSSCTIVLRYQQVSSSHGERGFILTILLQGYRVQQKTGLHFPPPPIFMQFSWHSTTILLHLFIRCALYGLVISWWTVKILWDLLFVTPYGVFKF